VIREALSPLAEREFRLLFFGRLVSFMGSAVAPVALAFAILDDLDGSASQLGIVLTATWLPQIAFILVGGVVADRLPRHLVLVGSNALSGVAQVFAAVVILTGTAELWHLFATQLVRGIAQAFFFPASTGLVPQVVSESKLQQANALLRMPQTGSAIVGTALGGILVAGVGSGWALAFDGVTYFASALILLLMRVPGRVRVQQGFVHELREGWGEFRSRQWIWTIVVAATFGNAIGQGSWAVLGPVIADRELGGADTWGFVLACTAAGLLAGGIVALRWRPRRYLLVAQISVTLSCANIVALAAGVPVLALAAGAFVLGFCVEIFGVYWDTALQQHVPRDALSRVSSYDALGSFVAIPIGLSIVGPVSDAIGIRTTLWIGAALFVVAQASVLLSREVRTLERRETPATVSPDPVHQAAIES
jgi:predicted MFS family arabinose efflux permease